MPDFSRHHDADELDLRGPLFLHGTDQERLQKTSPCGTKSSSGLGWVDEEVESQPFFGRGG